MTLNSKRPKPKLPRGMRVRVQRSGAVFYYYEPTHSQRRQEVALGNDYPTALLQRAKLLMNFKCVDSHKVSNFQFVSSLFLEVNLPTQEPHDQIENRKCIDRLEKYFCDHQLSFSKQTISDHKTAYQTWRGNTARTRSQREWSLLWVILKWISELKL